MAQPRRPGVERSETRDAVAAGYRPCAICLPAEWLAFIARLPATGLVPPDKARQATGLTRRRAGAQGDKAGRTANGLSGRRA